MHFKRDRLIQIDCDPSYARKRPEDERADIIDAKQKETAAVQAAIQEEQENREKDKEERVKVKEAAVGTLEEKRKEYKERLTNVMNERNAYREMISLRKDKEKALTDILSQDKVDLNALAKAVDEAKEKLVREEVIAKGAEMLEWLKYCKGVEQELQKATQEKSKEKLQELMAKIDAENIVLEPKIFNDAKNTLGKIK